MLVLTRRNGESIKIGKDIAIKVVSIQGNRVRLAIEAPEDVAVLRGELQPPQKKKIPEWLRDADACHSVGMHI